MGQVIDNYENIVQIANSEIPVFKDTPLFNLFSARKEACHIFLRRQDESVAKLRLEMIEYFNNEIKKYLGIW